MNKIIVLLVAATIGVLSAVGIANSGGENPPSLPAPSEARGPVGVVGPDGQALKCNGKLVKVSQETLGAGVPPVLTPEEARSRGNGPSISRFACAKDKAGKETGDVTAQETRNGMTITRTLPAG